MLFRSYSIFWQYLLPHKGRYRVLLRLFSHCKGKTWARTKCKEVDAFSSLGDSPVLGIEHSPCEREIILQDKSASSPFLTPRYRHFGVFDSRNAFDDRSEVVTFRGVERSCDVFPYNISWLLSIGFLPHLPDYPQGLKEKA